jgi:hypothetical protein
MNKGEYAMFCKNCGQKLQDGAVFCPDCGQKQDIPAGTPEQQPQAPAQQPPQPPLYTAAPPVKPKKRRGLKVFLIILLVLIAGAAGVYFLMPGLSRPVDLGVRSSRAAYESAVGKLGIIKDEAPRGGSSGDYSVVYTGSNAIDTSLTSEEITSFLGENRPPYYALKNVQVRINDDGTVEASGTIDTSYVYDVILQGLYSREETRAALPMLGLIPDKVNVYVKLAGSIDDNHVTGLNVEAASVMGITIPTELISSNEEFIVGILDDNIARQNARASSIITHLGISDGRIDFVGTLPASVERVPAQ